MASAHPSVAEQVHGPAYIQKELIDCLPAQHWPFDSRATTSYVVRGVARASHAATDYSARTAHTQHQHSTPINEKYRHGRGEFSGKRVRLSIDSIIPYKLKPPATGTACGTTGSSARTCCACGITRQARTAGHVLTGWAGHLQRRRGPFRNTSLPGNNGAYSIHRRKHK